MSLLLNFNFCPRGVIHLGAYYAEELPEYETYGSKFVIWAEANPALYGYLREILPRSTIKNYLYEGAITDKDDDEVEFYIYNHPEASSIYQVGKDLHKWYPHHKIEKSVKVPTSTVDNLLNKFPVDLEDIEYLNMDLQGAELPALMGAKNLLNNPHLKFIQVEAVSSEYYKGGTKRGDLTEVLSRYNFKEICEEKHHPMYPFIRNRIQRKEISDIDQVNLLFYRP